MTERVLLVDGDADLRATVGAFLEGTGCEVVTAATAADGIAVFDRQRPDVVVLDLQLPDRSGMDVLEDLRARGGAVLLLTGYGDVESAVQAMQRGALDCLTKPVDMPHLMAAIARVAETVHLRANLERMVAEVSRDGATRPDAIESGALERLLAGPWPDNVREMRNVIERAMIRVQASRAIRVRHPPTEVHRGGASGEVHHAVTLRDAERRLVAGALRRHRGNRTRTARELAISRVTLLKKIRDYGLEEETAHGG